MAKEANVIRIPKVPKDAFNMDRPISDLVRSQVEHLAAVVKKDIDDESRAKKKDIDDQRRAIRTQAHAGAFIGKMTALLHPEGASENRPSSSASAKKKTRPSKR